MADDGRAPKRFRPCKVCVSTKGTKGRRIVKSVPVKVNKYCRVSNKPVDSSCEAESDSLSLATEEISIDKDIVENKTAAQLSKHHLRRVKEYNSWEDIRKGLLQARIEEEAFSCETIKCVECLESLAICRCQDCGPRQMFCLDCAKQLHEKRNYFHSLEIFKVCSRFFVIRYECNSLMFPVCSLLCKIDKMSSLQFQFYQT